MYLTSEQLRNLYFLAKAAGHEWATTLPLDEALALGTAEAIGDEVDRRCAEDSFRGISAPPADGRHPFPSRGWYAVDSSGDIYVNISRPNPDPHSAEWTALSYSDQEDPKVATREVGGGTPDYLKARSWHYHFLADTLKYARPEEAEVIRQQALAMEKEESPDRKQEDELARIQAEIHFLTVRYGESFARLEARRAARYAAEAAAANAAGDQAEPEEYSMAEFGPFTSIPVVDQK
jgi:hypothetical protein